jgi:hypothetical protein
MGLYSQYISKTTSKFTSFFTSLQHKNINILEGLLGFKNN